MVADHSSAGLSSLFEGWYGGADAPELEAAPEAAPSPVTPAQPAPEAAAPAAPAGPGPVAVPPGAQMGVLRETAAALRRGARGARLTWRMSRRDEHGFIYGAEHYDPPSIVKQIAYRDGRGWVPDGHAGGWAEEWGVAYHTWWAIPAMTPAVLWIWVVTRPFRMAVFAGCLTLAAAAIAAVLILLGIL